MVVPNGEMDALIGKPSSSLVVLLIHNFNLTILQNARY